MELKLSPETARRVIEEEVSRIEVGKFLECLEPFPLLFMKGAGLGYSKYLEPWKRRRLDTDVWIDWTDLPAVETALLTAGYQQIPTNHGSLLQTQKIFHATDARGKKHYFDLHWKMLNPVIFRSTFEFTEVWKESVPLQALHPRARTLSDRHHLILCACHWVGHHFSEPSSAWMTDIELLIQEKERNWWKSVVHLCLEKKVAGIVRAVLARTASERGLGLPAFVLEELGRHGEERSIYFLRTDRNRWRDAVFDLRTLDTFRARARWLREHLFPDMTYMLATTSQAGSITMFRSYLTRIAKGLRKLRSVTRP